MANEFNEPVATNLKALTVCQPFAEFIAAGDKLIENRSWPTKYRGLLVIHAGKSRAWLEGDEKKMPFVFGAVLATCRLAACVHFDNGTEKDRLAKLHPQLLDARHCFGPWCWVLEDVRRLADPIPWPGSQGLFNFPSDVLPKDAFGYGEF